MNVIHWCKKKMEVPLTLWEEVMVHFLIIGSFAYREKNSAADALDKDKRKTQQQMLWIKMYSRCKCWGERLNVYREKNSAADVLQYRYKC
ncbi:hypothetical protein AMTRI_Chr06g197760 [Amborella trichopoda]